MWNYLVLGKHNGLATQKIHSLLIVVLSGINIYPYIATLVIVHYVLLDDIFPFYFIFYTVTLEDSTWFYIFL